MKKNLRVLIIEDSEDDAILEIHQIKKGGYDVEYKLVENADSLKTALQNEPWDVVISDYKMPSFTGLEALAIVKESGIDIPFIIISGTIGEDIAVEAMKAGAHDYIMKMNLQRMIPAIEREINESKNRQKQRLAEEALHQSEERFRRLTENAQDVIYRMSLPDGKYEYVSPASLLVFGYSPEEFYKNPSLLKNAIHPNWHKYFEEQWEKLIHGVMPQTYEYQIIHKSGDIRCLNQRNILIKDNTGLPIAIEGIVTDITERKQAEEALRENEERYRKAQVIGHVGSWEYNIQTAQFWGSDEAKRIYGFDVNASSFSTDEVENCIMERERVHQALVELIEQNKEYNLEFDIITKDSKTRKTVISVADIERDETGKPLKITGAIQDITDRKRIETAVSESEKRFKELANLLPQTIYESDINGIVTFANETALLTFGYTPDEISSGVNLLDMVSEKDKPDVISNMQRVLNGLVPSKNEYEMVRKNGSIFPALTFTSPIIRNGKTLGLRGTIVDITQRKQAENERRVLSEAVKQNPVSVIITDSSGNIEYVNPKFTELTGYSFEEVKGKNPRILQSGEKSRTEYETLWNTILSGNVWHGEFLNKKKSGELFWEKASISPIINENGDITHYVAIKEDVTEKKKIQMELIEAKEKAEHSDKLKTEFLSQMSHEIRTPMNGIINFAEIFRCELADKLTPEQFTFLDNLDKSGKRYVRTIELILKSAEMQTGNYVSSLSSFDVVNDVIYSILPEYINMSKQKRLDFSIKNNLSSAIVYADKDSVEQILRNLFDNAVKFTIHGQVEVSIDSDDTKKIFIKISDTGVGISEEFIGQLFNPFLQEDRGYSRRFEGNGLGLYLVKKYCDLNGIAIKVESEKGKGSSFTITFP